MHRPDRTGDKMRGFSANIKLTNINKLFRLTELEGEAMFITRKLHYNVIT